VTDPSLSSIICSHARQKPSGRQPSTATAGDVPNTPQHQVCIFALANALVEQAHSAQERIVYKGEVISRPRDEGDTSLLPLAETFLPSASGKGG